VNGGLGIKHLEFFSRSLRLRWLWYAWDATDRPWKELQLPVDGGDRNLFYAATRVELGNGCRASFWHSRWLDGDAPAALFPELFKHSKRKNRLVVDALTNNVWVRDVDHNMSQQVIAEYLHLSDRLQNVALAPTQEDKIIWVHSANGQYSARSAYKMQFEGLGNCNMAGFTWETKAPPKCRFFTWLLLQNRIWTAARLQIRQWPNEYFCQLCIRNLETAFHLFVECPVVRSIWDRVAIWVRSSNLAPVNWGRANNMKDWLLQLINSLPPAATQGLRSLIMLVLWEVWRERNARVFRKECRQVQRIMAGIYDEAKMWAYAGIKGLQMILPQLDELQLHSEALGLEANGLQNVVFFQSVN
jgi:hypothetical protein